MPVKLAYLTIDDAPSAHLPLKLDVLDRLGIQVVFFCRGELLDRNPAFAVDAIRRGHIIGNHSYDHPYFSERTLKKCIEQIDRTDQLIDAIYAQADQPRPAKFFRFPFGDKGGLTRDDVFSGYEGRGLERKNALQDHLRGLGYTKPAFPGITYRYYHEAGLGSDVDWYWTFDTVDWGLLSSNPPFGIDSLEKIIARMDGDDPEGGQGLNAPGSEEIVIMHDFEQTTPIFGPMIEHILAKGITFGPIPLT